MKNMDIIVQFAVLWGEPLVPQPQLQNGKKQKL